MLTDSVRQIATFHLPPYTCSFNMARGAGGRSGGVAGLFLVLVAFDTLLVHHLFGFELAGHFHLFKAVGFLWKGSMAGVAVLKSFLMGKMRKGHLPTGPSKYCDIFSPLIGGPNNGGG